MADMTIFQYLQPPISPSCRPCSHQYHHLPISTVVDGTLSPYLQPLVPPSFRAYLLNIRINLGITVHRLNKCNMLKYSIPYFAMKIICIHTEFASAREIQFHSYALCATEINWKQSVHSLQHICIFVICLFVKNKISQ
jgi:hypothetical protein